MRSLPGNGTNGTNGTALATACLRGTVRTVSTVFLKGSEGLRRSAAFSTYHRPALGTMHACRGGGRTQA